MQKLFQTIFIITLILKFTYAQESFPINGVKQNFEPIYAFTNAHIVISPEKEIKKGTLLIQNKKIHSAHDISDGGLYVCLVESGIVRNLGFRIFTNHDFRQDAYLFGESQSRVVVTVSSQKQKSFEKYLKSKIPFTCLGHVTDSKIVIDDVDFGTILSVKEDYMSSIEEVLKS